jgi:hypothetical protein
MRANMIVGLHTAGFMGCSTALDLRGGTPSPEPFTVRNEVPAEDEAVGLDAYAIAVLVSIAAAILSLCL